MADDKWAPYEYSGHKLPLHDFRKRYGWMFTYPLQQRVKDSKYTWGECLIVFPILWLVIAFFFYLFSLKDEGVGATGSLAQIWMLGSLFFAHHNSIVGFLIGIPFERGIAYHIRLARVSIIMSLLHGVWPGIEYMKGRFGIGGGGGGGEEEEGDGEGSQTVTGIIFAWLLVAIWLTSLYRIRRRLFHLFYAFHIFLVVIILVVAASHRAGAVVVGIVLWLVDLAIRMGYMAMARHSQECTLHILPAKVIRIEIPLKSFRYQGGQYIFIMIPKLSLWEWHPFSISSSPTDDVVKIHIRVLGDWTQALYEAGETYFKQNPDQQSKGMPLKCYFEGPYGSASIDIEGPRYKSFLMISGGIGITPIQSVTNQLLDQHQRGRPLSNLHFIWSVADRYMIDDNTVTNYGPKRLPYSFSPDLLRKHSLPTNDVEAGDKQDKEGGVTAVVTGSGTEPSPSSDSFLLTEFFLTRMREEDKHAIANVDLQVQQALRFGRPDLQAIFERMAASARAKGESHVGVMVCGPMAMVKDCRRLAAKFTTKDLVFDLHDELFDL